MADKFFEGLWVFILSAFIFCILVALGVELCTSDTAETEQYSSYCDCNGMYKMVNAEKLNGRLLYFWQCDKCGRAIKTEYLLNSEE